VVLAEGVARRYAATTTSAVATTSSVAMTLASSGTILLSRSRARSLYNAGLSRMVT
jgi:hypothetical protein